MSALAETAVCTLCGCEKPAEAFPRNSQMRSGLDSWCRQCKREYSREWYHNNLEKRQTRELSPHASKISNYLQQRDAVNYSRAVCDHVAWYVQRKITEFEATHKMEAPPHMVAILSIAKSISEQHPRGQRNSGSRGAVFDLTCRICERPFTARSPTTQYCDECRPGQRREQRREYKRRYRQTPAGRHSRAKEREKEKEQKNCEVCGKTMLASRQQKYCDDCRQQRQVERAKKLVTVAIQPRVIQCQRCRTQVTMVGRGRTRKYCLACAGEVAQEAKNELKRRQRIAVRERRSAKPHG